MSSPARSTAGPFPLPVLPSSPLTSSLITSTRPCVELAFLPAVPFSPFSPSPLLPLLLLPLAPLPLSATHTAAAAWWGRPPPAPRAPAASALRVCRPLQQRTRHQNTSGPPPSTARGSRASHRELATCRGWVRRQVERHSHWSVSSDGVLRSARAAPLQVYSAQTPIFPKGCVARGAYDERDSGTR